MTNENDNSLIENDDYPVFQLMVDQIGEQPAKIFAILRRILRISPAEAKHLLESQRFEVVRGARMEIESAQKELEQAGAQTRLILIQTD